MQCKQVGRLSAVSGPVAYKLPNQPAIVCRQQLIDIVHRSLMHQVSARLAK